MRFRVEGQEWRCKHDTQLDPADDCDRAGYENMLVEPTIGGRVRKALIQTCS